MKRITCILLSLFLFAVAAARGAEPSTLATPSDSANPIATDDFGTTAYVENVGVRPDKPVDYMTLDNLLNGGRTFVQAFTDAMVKQIRGN